MGQQEHEFPEDRDNPFEYFNTPTKEESFAEVEAKKELELGELESEELGVEMKALPPPRTSDGNELECPGGLSDDNEL